MCSNIIRIPVDCTNLPLVLPWISGLQEDQERKLLAHTHTLTKVHHRESYNVNGVSFVVDIVVAEEEVVVANAESAEFPFPVIHTNCESLKVAPIQSETDSCGSKRKKDTNRHRA